jgi:hypothetical protein
LDLVVASGRKAIPDGAALIFFDGDAAVIDLDLDAGCLLFLVEHIANHRGADSECADEDIEGIPGHFLSILSVSTV